MADNVQEKVENRIIDYVNLSAGGRLTVFRPDKKLKGASLVVKKKGEYDFKQAEGLTQNPVIKAQVFGSRQSRKTKEIWLYVNGQVKTGDKSLFKKEIDVNDFSKNKNLYLVFAFFNAIKQDIDDNLCILSLKEFKKNAESIKNDIFYFESFLSPEKKDKYSEFLVNRKDLSRFLLSIMSSV